ncbi:pyridoxal 5'-phosphate synthase-like subunit PDX1.2 [Tanacetum coccineum]
MNANTINDPLYIASSDHPGMILTNTSFNDSNFHGWSRNIKMALADLSDYTGNILGYLNSMVTKVSDAFLYAQSASDLWKEIGERYGQSNGPLVYQLERELSKITQGYPDWYKGKKAKKGNRLAAQVNSGFDEHFNGESPFDLGYENEAGILSCFTASFALFFHHDMNILLDWISDIGASDHILLVTIVGQVQLNPSLILTDVFYVPDFQLNLLFVGKLIKHKQLAAYFYAK